MSRNQSFYLDVGICSLQDGERRLYYKKERRTWGTSKRNVLRDEMKDKGEDTVVKLNVLQIYSVTVTVKPSREIKYLCLDGEKLELKSVPQPLSTEDNVKYKTHWDTKNYEATKQGDRKRVTIEVEFTTGEYLKTSLLAKFYPANDRLHSRQGVVFGTLSLLCQSPEGTYVNIHNRQLL